MLGPSIFGSRFFLSFLPLVPSSVPSLYFLDLEPSIHSSTSPSTYRWPRR